LEALALEERRAKLARYRHFTGLYWIGLDWIGLLILSTGQLVGQDLHPSRGIAEQVPSSTLGIDSCASHAVE
jgi:hypothetical protein